MPDQPTDPIAATRAAAERDRAANARYRDPRIAKLQGDTHKGPERHALDTLVHAESEPGNRT